MKRIIHILIAALFIYNLMGYFVVFHALQYRIKKEVKKALKADVPEAALTVIAVTERNKTELHWFKAGKEFMYHNRMFDIVRKEQKGNIIYYYCINDTQEEELFANLDQQINSHVKNDLSTNKKTKSVLQKIVKDLFFIPKLSFNGNSSVNISFPGFSENEESIIVEALVPPPKSQR